MMRATSYMLVLLFCMLLEVFGQPTTPFIKEVFIGKCYEQNPNQVLFPNCTLLWEKFAQGAKMDMGKVKDADFAPFFEYGNFLTPVDNALFWSGNKDFAHKLSADGSIYTTLEETSTGFILNGLSWCGKPYVNGVPPDFDYVNNCIFGQNATFYGQLGVWRQMSQHFARNVIGQVNILLEPQPYNYDRSGPIMAYRNNSIFAQIELPNMNVSRVTKIRILVLADKTKAPTEMCGSGSLKVLADQIQKKFNFTPACIDQPEDLLEILCFRQSDSPECVVAKQCQKESEEELLNEKVKKMKTWAIIGTVCACVLLTVVIVLLSIIVKQRKHSYHEIN